MLNLENFECRILLHDRIETGSYHLKLRPASGSALSSSHHHPDMNFYNIFLLLLVVLSAFFENPQHGKPPDSLDFALVAICPNSSSDSLGVLAPVSPRVRCLELSYLRMRLDQCFRMGVFKFVLPQNGVFEVVPSQTEINKTVLPQNEMFNRVINTMNSLLNIAVKIMEFLISTVVHGAEKLAWTIQILLEGLHQRIRLLFNLNADLLD
jgi:hypothetical protein